MNKLCIGAILLSMLFGSCSFRKLHQRNLRRADSANASAVQQQNPGLPPAEPARPQNSEQALELALLRSRDFRTFTAKSKMSFEGGGRSNDFTALVRMRKDSAIWINISALEGIVSVARVLITPDSIHVINHLQREVIHGPASAAAKLLPAEVRFDQLQRLFLGEALLQEGNLSSLNDERNTWYFGLTSDQYRQQTRYSHDSLLQNLQLQNKQGSFRLEIDYAAYARIADRLFPGQRSLQLSNDGNRYKLDMLFSNISFNEPAEFTFSPPPKYTVKYL